MYVHHNDELPWKGYIMYFPVWVPTTQKGNVFHSCLQVFCQSLEARWRVKRLIALFHEAKWDCKQRAAMYYLLSVQHIPWPIVDTLSRTHGPRTSCCSSFSLFRPFLLCTLNRDPLSLPLSIHLNSRERAFILRGPAYRNHRGLYWSAHNLAVSLICQQSFWRT